MEVLHSQMSGFDLTVPHSPTIEFGLETIHTGQGFFEV